MRAARAAITPHEKMSSIRCACRRDATALLWWAGGSVVPADQAPYRTSSMRARGGSDIFNGVTTKLLATRVHNDDLASCF